VKVDCFVEVVAFVVDGKALVQWSEPEILGCPQFLVFGLKAQKWLKIGYELVLLSNDLLGWNGLLTRVGDCASQ
jgi:hypothetical protein